MDAYAYQQSQRYMNMRPPQPPVPPSTSDPQHHQHHLHHQFQQAPPPRPQAPWFPNQFQYHTSQSPSPPPQWPPPPPPPPPPTHSDHLPQHPSYPPPPNPYPTHNQFPPPPPPPRPHLPPPPHSQLPQSYPQANQEWGTSNWGHQQSYNYPVPAHSNEEDWAARARAWADAKTAMENQHSQSQFTPVGRLEDQSHYYDQYPQSVDAHYPDVQHQSLPGSSYQQFPVSGAPLHRPSVVHTQETASISSEPSSHVPDAHLPYNVRDGTLAGDSSALFHHQGPSSSSVHQQEVPSSYSSITGREDTADQNGQSYKILPLPNSSAQEGHHHVQPLHAPFMYGGNQPADSTANLADQPLDFAPRFNHDHDSHMQSSYALHDSVGPLRGVDPVAAGHLINNWTPPVTPGLVYPSISPDIASGAQHDPSIAIHSSIPAHAAPPFGRFPGPGQPTIPSGGAPFTLSAGTALHPTTAFSGEAYGISTLSERPKKASVPNWLKEEIKKAVITTSVEHPRDETQSIEDEGIDKSFGKADQADSKSIDSSRSTEEEDDDEDYVEAAKTAAINQEIKRVLTEVLLKVTDELFDEIATKVLSEDDLTVDVHQNNVTSNHKVLPSSHLAVPGPKPSAKVLIPTLAKDSDTKSLSEKSSSSSPGDVLGLGNYASDDDDGDDEIKSSSVPNSNSVLQQSSIKKLSEDTHDTAENGISKVELKENNRSKKKMESGVGKTISVEFKSNDSAPISEMNDNRVDRDLGHTYSSKVVSVDTDDGISVSGKMLDGTNSSRSKNTAGVMESELSGEYVNVKKTSTDDPQHSESRRKLDKNDRHESKRSSGKDSLKEGDGSKIRADENGDERRRQDERHSRRGKTDDGSKERKKEQNFKPGEKAKESESRKRSDRLDVKDDRKETERLNRASAKEDTHRKRERRKDEEEDRSRHKTASESSRHKRRRSSSISSKGRNSKDNSISHANDSSDEASDDSKRKLQSRKRSSPSPVRSRRRQVSRSPHSKHSQRRHSPYSSLETTRGRRSGSRSPVRRHR